jgi:N-methylhydantoinase A
VEIVNARVAAVGLAEPAEFELESPSDATGDAQETRSVYFDEVGDFTETPIYSRLNLLVGAAIAGPAIVEQMDTTVLIPPNSRARVDERLNLVIDVAAPVDEMAALAAAGPIDRGA